MIGFNSFSVISWNEKKAANNSTKRHIKELISSFKSYVLYILEPHVEFKATKKFWDKLGCHVIAINEASGHSGWHLGPFSNF